MTQPAEPEGAADQVKPKASDLQILVEAAKAAGLDSAQINELQKKYEERTQERADRAAQVRFCGNVGKERMPNGRLPVCGREPHPDEPGNRTAHALRLADESLVTWFSPLTIGEQVEEENKTSDPKCNADSEPLDGKIMKCKRTVHGADKPHYDVHPDLGPMTW